MARWDEDRYDYEPRRGRQDERGYGATEGLRGAGRRDWQQGRDWDRNDAGEYDRSMNRDYDSGRDYDRGMNRDYDRGRDYDREMGRHSDRYLSDEDRAMLEGRGSSRGYERDYEGRRSGYGMGSRYGMDSGRVTFERQGEHHGRGPKGWTRSNERVREDACERMAHHGHLDATNIDIAVNNGEVTLTGTVNNRLQKRIAEDIADSVSGVRDVHNRLTVQRETESELRQNREGRTRGATEA